MWARRTFWRRVRASACADARSCCSMRSASVRWHTCTMQNAQLSPKARGCLDHPHCEDSDKHFHAQHCSLTRSHAHGSMLLQRTAGPGTAVAHPRACATKP